MNNTSQTGSISPLIQLPPEVLYQVRTYLSPEDNGRLSCVERYFASMDGWNQEVWKGYVKESGLTDVDIDELRVITKEEVIVKPKKKRVFRRSKKAKKVVKQLSPEVIPSEDFRRIFCRIQKSQKKIHIPEEMIKDVDIEALSKSRTQYDFETFERIVYYRNEEKDTEAVIRLSKELPKYTEDEVAQIYHHVIPLQPQSVLDAYAAVRIPEKWDMAHRTYAFSKGITLPTS